MTAPPALRAVEHHVSPADIQDLRAGEGGVDLRQVVVDGRHVMKVVGVGPGSTAARLGAVNDDVIESINGMPLDSIPNAYAAGAAAVARRRVEIRGTRAGVPYVTVLVVDG